MTRAPKVSKIKKNTHLPLANFTFATRHFTYRSSAGHFLYINKGWSADSNRFCKKVTIFGVLV